MSTKAKCKAGFATGWLALWFVASCTAEVAQPDERDVGLATAALGEQCGGIAGIACPDDLVCIDDPHDDCDPEAGGADCAGLCAHPFCGGFPGFPCPEGLTCVDDPTDDCDPEAGGADCAGVCVLESGPACGDKTCAPGTVCCNASCGICTPPGDVCTQQACEPTGECPPGACGPPLGAPNIICPDGETIGGPGDCVRDATGRCAWEFIECPDEPPPQCQVAGCSGQLCAGPDDLTITTCEYRPEYACLRFSECGNFGPEQSCGWKPTRAYKRCLRWVAHRSRIEARSLRRHGAK